MYIEFLLYEGHLESKINVAFQKTIYKLIHVWNAKYIIVNTCTVGIPEKQNFHGIGKFLPHEISNIFNIS